MASFMDRLKAAKEILAAKRAAEDAAEAAALVEATELEDPWLAVLASVRGDLDRDHVETISTRQLCDILELRQDQRKAGAFQRIARLMVSLSWQPNRVYKLNGRGFREQIRGFSRYTEPLLEQQTAGVGEQQPARLQA